MERRRDTVVRASWRLLEAENGADEASAPDPLAVLAVPLKAGDATQAKLTVPVPKTPGRWVLTLDIADEIVGSFATSGSAPRTLVVMVVDGRSRPNPGD
jgi:hypothetical protein